MRQGFFWWELDLTYYSLRRAEFFGLIWDVRRPSLRSLRGSCVACDRAALDAA